MTTIWLILQIRTATASTWMRNGVTKGQDGTTLIAVGIDPSASSAVDSEQTKCVIAGGDRTVQTTVSSMRFFNRLSCCAEMELFMPPLWKKRMLRFWMAVCVPMAILCGIGAYDDYQDSEMYREMVFQYAMKTPISDLLEDDYFQGLRSSMQANHNSHAVFVLLTGLLLLLPLLVLGMEKLVRWIWGVQPATAQEPKTL